MDRSGRMLVAAAVAALLGLGACSNKFVSEPQPEAVAPAPLPILNDWGVNGQRRALDALRDQDTVDIAAESAPRNPWLAVRDAPLSTFSIDVDTGSYARARRALRAGSWPSPQDVRVEEFVNYFDYGYPEPGAGGPPLAVTTAVAATPWNPNTVLLQIGVQGQRIASADLPPANLVFLVDTSGSMDMPDRLPLLKEALRTLSAGLRAQDKVSLVAYAGSAGLVLPATPGDRRGLIVDALESLSAGGSTDGGQGIALAYDVAERNRIAGGINRIILATDGDFNVGLTSRDSLKDFVAQQRARGISLSTLGFGDPGYLGEVAEVLAAAGDGNYAFIDDELEARRVLANELGATLHTIAADVKLQVAFDPSAVAAYRLIGYENRRLAAHQFADDRVDAGEVGAGDDVTALYELQLIAPGSATVASTLAPGTLAEVRLRWKPPGTPTSRLATFPVVRADIGAAESDRQRLAAAVAAFAQHLRGDVEVQAYTMTRIAQDLRDLRWPDAHGEVAELADLVELAEALRPAAVAQPQ